VTTKTLLVSFDPDKPDSRTTDFLAVQVEGAPAFIGMKTKKVSSFGLLVYVGKQLSAADLFAKLVDSGHRIESVPRTLNALERYIELLQTFRIGNVLTVEPDRCNGFNLIKFASTPPSTGSSKLP